MFDAGLRSSRYPHPAISVDLHEVQELVGANKSCFSVLGHSDMSHTVADAPRKGVDMCCLMHPLPHLQRRAWGPAAQTVNLLSLPSP
eukprot:768521-Hanusia_phi.AAC.2